MNRFGVSIVIVLSIAALNIFSVKLIKEEKINMYTKLSDIQNISRTDKESVLKASDELELLWSKSYKKLSFFIEADELDEISDNILKIKPLIIADSDEILAETTCAMNRIEQLYQRNLPKIYNIF